MTNADRALLKKLEAMGNFCVFKTKERGWIAFDMDMPFDEVRLENLRRKNLEVIWDFDSRNRFIWDSNEWQHVSGCDFVATKDTVYSIPMLLRVYIVSLPAKLNLEANKVDLTNFVGVSYPVFLNAQEVIVGEDVLVARWNKWEQRLVSRPSSEPSTLLGADVTSVVNPNSKIDRLKWIQSRPVRNLYYFMGDNQYIKSLDLSEVNLKECRNFNYFCANCSKLKELKLSKFDDMASCGDALDGTPLAHLANDTGRELLSRFVVSNDTAKSSVF